MDSSFFSKTLTRLEKSRSFWALLITCVGYFLLRVPSLFEPIWYGDEALYQVMGKALLTGRTLYTGIWDNKPPLLYYTYALFGGDQFSVRLASIFIGMVSIVLFFFLAKIWISGEKKQFIATGLFAFFLSSPMFMGNTFNAEHLVLPCVLAGVLIWQRTLTLQKPSLKHFYLAGLLFGVGFMVKVNPIFDITACGLVLLFNIKRKSEIASYGAKVGSTALGFMTPFLWFVLFFFVKGGLAAFISSAFLSNVGYAEYANNFFVSGQFFLILKFLVLLGFCGFVYIKRSHLSQQYRLLLIWSGWSLFSVLLTQRNYPHYAVLLLPSFIILGTLICVRVKERMYRAMRIPFVLGLISVAVVIQPNIFSIIPYYWHFGQYITNSITLTQYFASFDSRVPRDYAVAQFVNTKHPKANEVLVWGDNPQIYTLTNTLPQGPLIVAYHVGFSKTSYAKEVALLQKQLPRIIVLYPNQSFPPVGMGQYKNDFSIEGVHIYERNTQAF